jgi:hypothetical protein
MHRPPLPPGIIDTVGIHSAVLDYVEILKFFRRITAKIVSQVYV